MPDLPLRSGFVDELSLWQAVVLGVVEGITEYLPVSSTGHLILLSSLLGLGESADAKRNIDAYHIVIQGGAILAVLGLYRERVGQMLLGLKGQNPVGLLLVRNLLIAFFPAVVLGLLLKERIETYLFYPGPVLAALAVGGIVMILIGPWQRRFLEADRGEGTASEAAFTQLEELSWRAALFIGFMQCVAMWPGTSRSMVTIVGGMIVGMKPRQAAEFSFLLGLPTLSGACVYSAAKNLTDTSGPNMIEALGLLPIVVGIVVSTIAAVIGVRALVTYLSRHSLAIFGWYRLALSGTLAWLFWSGVIHMAGP